MYEASEKKNVYERDGGIGASVTFPVYPDWSPRRSSGYHRMGRVDKLRDREVSAD